MARLTLDQFTTNDKKYHYILIKVEGTFKILINEKVIDVHLSKERAIKKFDEIKQHYGRT